MTGAIALAIVLVIAVVGISMAMQSQQAGTRPMAPRAPRAPRPPVTSRRTRDRTRGASPPPETPPPAAPPEPKEPDIRPEILRSGLSTEAKVISVVDERTTGPVTRSRLTLEIEPEGGAAYEVTVRVAFPTPESRSSVRVGGTVPVRYDKDDRTRVVVDLPDL